MRHLRLSDEDLTALVCSVEARELGADERLYEVMRNAFGRYLILEVGHDHWEDRLNNTYLAVLDAIHKRRLETPASVLSFAHVVIYRQICDEIGHRIEQRAAADAEEVEAPHDRFDVNEYIDRQRRIAVMREALTRLDSRDQEVLRRFYLLEQKPAEIIREMGLTYTQFRLYKSRAKKRLGIHGRAIQKPTLRKQSDKARGHHA